VPSHPEAALDQPKRPLVADGPTEPALHRPAPTGRAVITIDEIAAAGKVPGACDAVLQRWSGSDGSDGPAGLTGEASAFIVPTLDAGARAPR
jgi:hypothetical protein